MDPVLRQLFEEESEGELAGIEALLPRAAEPEVAAVLVRHAHTIKGSAAVLGLAEVNRIAAALEEVFEHVRDGKREVTPTFQDAIRATVADLRYIVSGALGGLDVSRLAGDAEHALAQLDATTAPAPDAAHDLLRAVAAAQLATLRLTAANAGVPATSIPEYRDLAALLGNRSRVLVVEDSPTVRARHEAIFADGGYAVRTAQHGAEALELLATAPADAVVTDLEMPAMDGWELTRAIRTHPELAGIGVVVVSSRGDDEARRRSASAGADAHVEKGVAPQELLQLVDRVASGT